ncbi:28580_t:CDS:2, partial [Gigaspora margarita]
FNSGIGKKIAQLLCKNNTLKCLVLNENKITSDDGNEIFDILSGNTSLTHLDILYNSLDHKSESGYLIAEDLDKNTNLKFLNLQNNNFTIETIQSFINNLLKNIALIRLDLSFNLKFEDIQHIQQYIEQKEYDT